MERIKGKHDDLNNKIRPGTVWVPGFTIPGNNDDLRAIDSNGAEMHFTPISRYYASCKIKRGQAVSIAQLADLTKAQRSNKYAYVKVTDPDIDESCIGIAINYAEEGQIVQIQNTGKFNYYTTNSILCTEERKKTEVFLDADGWLFDEVRGQRLFIKKLYNNETNAEQDDSTLRGSSTWEGIPQDENGDAFDTDHLDQSTSADTSDSFTYDFIDSIYNVKNTIQIGYLTDAPSLSNGDYTSYKKSTKKITDPLTQESQTITVFTDIEGNEVVACVVERNSKGEIVLAEEFVDPNGVVDNNVREKGTKPPKAHEAVWLQKVVKEGKESYQSVDDHLVTIELDVTGDTRGPIDNTQFILTLGESIHFSSKKQDLTLVEPHFNEGIFDELKVVAISHGIKCGPMFRVFNKVVTANDELKLENGFISLRKLDGDTYVIPVCCDLTQANLENDLHDVNDDGYYRLTKEFMSLSERPYILDGKETERKPRLVIADKITNITRDVLIEAIKKGLQSIFVDDETNVNGCTPVVTYIGDDGFTITTKEFGGYYDMYVSASLLSYVSFTAIRHGNAAEPGTAVLADIRDTDRLNVAGVVISNQTGIHKKGETIKVIKIGRVVTLGNLKPGAQYYLGLNGRLTAKLHYWYDHCVPIATAESSNYLLVDISPVPMHSYSGNFPLGYLKPSVCGQPEKGFLMMDGITAYSKDQYPELYNLLLNWFDEEQLKPSKRTEEDMRRKTTAEYQEIFKVLFSEINELKQRIAYLENPKQDEEPGDDSGE